MCLETGRRPSTSVGLERLRGCEGGARNDGVNQRELHRCACLREKWSAMLPACAASQEASGLVRMACAATETPSYGTRRRSCVAARHTLMVLMDLRGAADAGKNVFITGTTGFVGKCVLEKVGWACVRSLGMPCACAQCACAQCARTRAACSLSSPCSPAHSLAVPA